jgi:hypothetical protein
MQSSMRGAIIVVAICSWFAVSNHCAFAALATKKELGQAGCPFHSKPAQQEQPSTGAQCCKILRAIAPVVTKSWMRDHANFSSADLSLEEWVCVQYSRIALAPRYLHTGPPNARSFAELVLQRSLVAHAPPVRV